MERKKNKVERPKDREKFRLLFENAQVGIVRLDLRSGRISETNSSAAAIFGYSSTSNLRRVRNVKKHFISTVQLKRVYRQLRKHGAIKSIEIPMKQKNGNRIWVNLSCWQVGEDGQLVDAVVLDNTDLHQSQQELSIKNEQLIQADKLAALGTLVAGVAHEINNPTSFITMNIPLLKDAWEQALPILEEYQTTHGEFKLAGLDFNEMKEEISSICSDILIRAKSISKIVTDLKDFAREKPINIWEKVNINDVLKLALVLTNNTIKKATKNFRLSYGDGMPLISANSQRLQQVIINLIVNACQSLRTHSEGIAISTCYDPDGSQVMISVRDEGKGISKKDMDKIFNPFFTTKEKGTGLGLSISYGIVKDHGGEMFFTSRINKGTEAIVILPVSQ